MPVIRFFEIPLPSLPVYTSISFFMFSYAFYQATLTCRDIIEISRSDDNSSLQHFEQDIVNLTLSKGMTHGTVAVLLSELWMLPVVINMAYCFVLLLGKLIQLVVFGRLRTVERQTLREKFWNFLMYKFVFIFGIMNIETYEDIVWWCTWFTIIGFLTMMIWLCKARFEYIAYTPVNWPRSHAKILILLWAVLFACVGLTAFSIVIGRLSSWSMFGFLFAEVLLLAVRTSHMLYRFAIHLYDIRQDRRWEARTTVIYYADLVADLICLLIDFAHNIHMLLWNHMLISVASLLIFSNIRFIFNELKRRWKRHRNYLKVVEKLESRFPWADKDELQLQSDDKCAVCWEQMQSARKLPCGHLFHNSCIRSWLEQDVSCPTCRAGLGSGGGEVAAGVTATAENEQREENRRRNHFFRFDGSRYLSWLPNFSVEVTHTFGRFRANTSRLNRSQYDAMVIQVRTVFPHLADQMILDDLRSTHSVELTIDNILQGRLNAHMLESDSESSSEPASPETDASPAPVVSASDRHASEQPRRRLDAADTSNLALRNFFQTFVSRRTPPPHPVLDQPQETQHETLPKDDIEPLHMGGRFSKSADERELMLLKRKRFFIEEARRRYLNRRDGDDGDIEREAKDKDV